MTFTESVGKELFDFRAALSAPGITGEQWEEMRELSRYWNTCGCGQCDVRIPRRNGDIARRSYPVDVTLYELGVEFDYAIKNHAPAKALEMLDKIKAREAELLAAMATTEESSVVQSVN